MPAYSDRITHAFAFAAKYAPGAPRARGGLAELADAANLAVILSRYDCDELTIVAGILHLVLRDSEGAERAALEQKVREKFGSIVLAILEDVLAPPSGDLNRERAWEACRREYLARLATRNPARSISAPPPRSTTAAVPCRCPPAGRRVLQLGLRDRAAPGALVVPRPRRRPVGPRRLAPARDAARAGRSSAGSSKLELALGS